jgi:hypothetical protein
MRKATNTSVTEALAEISSKAIEMEDAIQNLAQLYAADGHVHAVHHIMIEFHKPHRAARRLRQICDNLTI